MKPIRTPGMKVITLLIVLEREKSGPGMEARRTQAEWRAKAVLIIRTSKALWWALAIRFRSGTWEVLLNEGGRESWLTSMPRR